MSWLRVINYTDCYTMENFARLRTLIDEKRAEVEKEGGKTVVLCSGDFLAPYLLSSLDGGRSMMSLMNELPVDIATIGNHEDDVPFAELVKRVKQFKGTWVSSNMQIPECGDLLKEFFVIEADSRRIGIIGALSDDEALYRKNAFGGAKISDPYDAIERVSKELKEVHKVDFILPAEHLYVPQDMVTCERFDFPVVISGHDHHVVDEVHHGTRLLKAGSDAKHAIVLDIRWKDNGDDCKPTVDSTTYQVKDFAENADIADRIRKAYSILDHLKHTTVAKVDSKYRPLFSEGSRSRQCSVASFLWSAFRDALNSDSATGTVDCVIISGGDVRGGTNYSDDHHLSLADLRSELQEELEAVIVGMPGSVVAEGIEQSREAGSNAGFIQVDDSIQIDSESGKVTHLAGEEIDDERVYNIATTMWSLKNGSATAWIEWFSSNPDAHPHFDAPVLATVLSYLSSEVWQSLWHSIDTNHDGKLSEEELLKLDLDNDGRISRHEMAVALRKLGFEVDEIETSFLDLVMEAAGDKNHDGYLDVEEVDLEEVATE